jgi:hypothetical protein
MNYNASAVKPYNTTSSLVPFINISIFFVKHPSRNSAVVALNAAALGSAPVFVMKPPEYALFIFIYQDKVFVTSIQDVMVANPSTSRSFLEPGS